MKIETLIGLMEKDVIVYDENGCACKMTNEDKQMIESALAKQKPERTKQYESIGMFNDGSVAAIGICPSCDRYLGTASAPNYCPTCGQRIEWRTTI